MEYQKPKVKDVYPVGNNGLQPLPDYLDAASIVERSEIHLYNPFSTGVSVKTYPASGITYKLLSNSFIVDSPDLIEKLGRGHSNLERHQSLAKLSESFWPVAAATFQRLLTLPKRDNGLNRNITPDMGLTVSPPKRKIEGPKNTRRPGPPTPGGR